MGKHRSKAQIAADEKAAKENAKKHFEGVYIKFPADLKAKCEAVFARVGYEEKRGYETLVRMGLSKMTDKDIELLEMRKDYMTEPEFIETFPPHFASYLTTSGQIAAEDKVGIKWFSRIEVWALSKKYNKVVKDKA